MIEARQAVEKLQKEIVFFDQLAVQFPTVSHSLTKHANDCRRVGAALQRRLDDKRFEDAEKALHVAHVFLKEGQRQRLKLRIGLMQQLITALELEAPQWQPMTSAFQAHAAQCRNALSHCRQQLHPGASDDIKFRLRELSDLHKQGEALRQQQKQSRLDTAGRQLSITLDQLESKQEQFSSLAQSRPELHERYQQLAEFSAVEHGKIKPWLFSRKLTELEKSLGYAQKVYYRIVDGEEKAEVAYQQLRKSANELRAVAEPKKQRKKKEKRVSLKRDAEFGPIKRTLRFAFSPMRRDGITGAVDYMQHTVAHLVTGLGKFMLYTVGTLVVIAILAMMFYLTGSGFLGVGLL